MMCYAHSTRHASPRLLVSRFISAVVAAGMRPLAALIVPLLFITGFSYAGAQYVIERAGYGGGRLHFISASEAFAIGERSVAHSSDSGYTWQVVSSDIPKAIGCEGIFGGSFVNGTTGWIIAHKLYTSDSTFIYKTSDGGATWHRLRASPIAAERYASHSYNAIHFVDENEGWVIGKGIIEHTTDGGATWSPQLLWPERQGNNDYLNCGYFRNRKEGWAGGYGSIIVHTTDGGKNWITQHTDSATRDGMIVNIDNYYLHAIRFADPMNGFAATNNGNYLSTRDGGATWRSGSTGFPNDNVALYTIDEKIVWQVGGDYCDNTGCYSGQSVLYSHDGGATWHSLVDTTLGLLGLNSQFRSIHFINPKLGYIANERGEIFRIRDTTSTNVAGIGQGASSRRTLSVYPNPARETVTIQLGDDEGEGRIMIYDIAGELVASHETAGGGTARISTAGLRAGLYIIEVAAGGRRARAPMTVVR
jgi:photosystem II stability/assembly factor-like uncharacterized protein